MSMPLDSKQLHRLLVDFAHPAASIIPPMST